MTHTSKSQAKTHKSTRASGKRRNLPGNLSLADRYRRNAVLFALKGAWPISRVQDERGWLPEPPMPPEGMSLLEISRINALLAKQNWTLVTGPDGKLKPVRTI